MSFLTGAGTEGGYLLRLVQQADQSPRAWLLLRTADFEPLAAMPQALAALAAAAKSVAADHLCCLDERSVGGVDDSFLEEPDRELGHIASLRDYTYADGSADSDRLLWHLALLLGGRKITALLAASGAVARIGGSLIGREAAREQLVREVALASVMLLGPRRNGKTTLLRWLVDEPPAGFAPVYLDLERIAEPAALAVELCVGLRKHPAATRFKLAELESEIPEDPVAAIAWRNALYARIGDGWADFLRRLLRAASDHLTPLLLLDEFGDFLELLEKDGDRLRPFLVEIQHLAATGPQRLIITGSRSLEFLIERLDIGNSFQSFRRFALPDFEQCSARRLFEERLRARDIRPAREVTEKALALVGHNVPFYIQLLADAVLPQLSPGDFTEPERLVAAYQTALLGHAGQAYFSDLERRMKTYDAFVQRRAGQLVLRLIAERRQVHDDDLRLRYAQAKFGSEEQFRWLMTLLEEYFFLSNDGGNWRFRAPVLRDYALRYFLPGKF
jgi:hypothetical protein